nr:uncharacterized protein LOC117994592 [Maniola hyperantus]
MQPCLSCVADYAETKTLSDNQKHQKIKENTNQADQEIHRDFNIIESIWKGALQKAQLGKNFKVIPEVNAVKVPEEPQENTLKGIDQVDIDLVFNGDLYIIEKIWKNAIQKSQLGANYKIVHATKLPKATDQDNIDLYIIGRIWIRALQKALLGANFNVIPVVHAAKQPEPPQKPPKMKYTDLPIYESPHNEYKEYLEDKDKCLERNTKLLHKFLLPYTKKYRKIAQENLCHAKCIVNKYCVNTCACVKKAKNDFKATMRDPENLAVRQAVVGVGTLTGYLIGGGGGLPRRFFFTSIGFLATGALCFPKETDEVFRSFTYMVAKAVISIYNMACNKNADLRERLACREDLPSPPPQRKAIQCPPKK